MNFKEEFPSLKGKILVFKSINEFDKWIEGENKFVEIKNIQKYCLDKQNYEMRVVEAIRIMHQCRDVPSGSVKLVNTIFGKSFEEIALMIQWHQKNAYDLAIKELVEYKQKVKEVIEKFENKIFPDKFCKFMLSFELKLFKELKKELKLE